MFLGQVCGVCLGVFLSHHPHRTLLSGEPPSNTPLRPRMEQGSAWPATGRQAVGTRGLDPIPSWLSQDPGAFLLDPEPDSRNWGL